MADSAYQSAFRNFKYCITFVDSLTFFVFLVPVTSLKSASIAKSLELIIGNTNRSPKYLYTGMFIFLFHFKVSIKMVFYMPEPSLLDHSCRLYLKNLESNIWLRTTERTRACWPRIASSNVYSCYTIFIGCFSDASRPCSDDINQSRVIKIGLELCPPSPRFWILDTISGVGRSLYW